MKYPLAVPVACLIVGVWGVAPSNAAESDARATDWSANALARSIDDWIADFRKTRVPDWLPVASSSAGVLEMQLSSFRASDTLADPGSGNPTATPKAAVDSLRNFRMRVRNVDTDVYVMEWLHVLDCDERTYQMQQYKEFNEHGEVTQSSGALDVKEIGTSGNFHILYQIACHVRD